MQRIEVLIGGILLGLVAVGLLFLFSFSDAPPEPFEGATYPEQPYQEIVNPSGFVNTDGITIGELVGEKVILVDFLTYSCINCQRTFPYLTKWYERYKDDGLEIVGIHTPEFAFEKDIQNVRRAMEEFGVTYPIVLDNDYATWRAYGNRYWPRKYLIDIHGNVVYDHIGEGAYEETEMKIRELLEERAQVLGLPQPFSGESLASAEVPKTTNRSQTPETYFGAWRNEFLGNGEPFVKGTKTFTLPNAIERNTLYFDGEWTITQEHALGTGGSSFVYRYRAQEVFLVMRSDEGGVIRVTQDGALLGEVRGESVSPDGTAAIQESALYKLIKNKGGEEHTLEIEVLEGEVEFYAFTFG